MPIKISAESLSAIKLGASDLTAAYVGETRIFPNDITVSYVTPTGQGLTYTTPQTTIGSPGGAYSQTFVITGTSTQLLSAGSFSVSGLPTGLTAAVTNTSSGLGNSLTVTISGVYPQTPALNIAMVISGVGVTTYTQYTINYTSSNMSALDNCQTLNPANTVSPSLSVANSIDVTNTTGSQTGYVPSFPQTVTYSLSSNTVTYSGAYGGSKKYYFIGGNPGTLTGCDVCLVWGNNQGSQSGTYQLSLTGNLTGGSTLYGGSSSRSWYLSLTGGGTSSLTRNIPYIVGDSNGLSFWQTAGTVLASGTTGVLQINQMDIAHDGFFGGSCNKSWYISATNNVNLYLPSNMGGSGTYQSYQSFSYGLGNPFGSIRLDTQNAPSNSSYTVTVSCNGPVTASASMSFMTP